MEDQQKTIGLAELLDEVSRDLDDYRRKHPNDFGLRGVTLWWDTEKERLSMRHGSATVRIPSRHGERWKRLGIWFLSAWTVVLSINSVISLLL